MQKKLVLGHRGAPYAATENTLAAFRAALDEGADGVELDVQLTRDGVLALHHDTVVDGVPVHQRTFGELEATLGHPLSTLDEVLHELPRSAVICVEFKRQQSLAELDAHRRIPDLVRATRDVGRTWIGSFDPWFLRACRAAAPDVPCGLILDGRTLVSPESFDPAALEFASVVSMEVGLVGTPVLTRSAAEGLSTYAWPVDRDEDLARCLATPGLTAVITKHPGRAVGLRG
jgi:glycerophosphoryl diester phosphodiesterase